VGEAEEAKQGEKAEEEAVIKGVLESAGRRSSVKNFVLRLKQPQREGMLRESSRPRATASVACR
jgi:hypothetical protein